MSPPSTISSVTLVDQVGVVALVALGFSLFVLLVMAVIGLGYALRGVRDGWAFRFLLLYGAFSWAFFHAGARFQEMETYSLFRVTAGLDPYAMAGDMAYFKSWEFFGWGVLFVALGVALLIQLVSFLRPARSLEE